MLLVPTEHCGFLPAILANCLLCICELCPVVIKPSLVRGAPAIMQAPVPIRTEVEDLRNYTKAEEHHQQYLAKGGRFGNPQSTVKGCEEHIRCYG